MSATTHKYPGVVTVPRDALDAAPPHNYHGVLHVRPEHVTAYDVTRAHQRGEWETLHAAIAARVPFPVHVYTEPAYQRMVTRAGGVLLAQVGLDVLRACQTPAELGRRLADATHAGYAALPWPADAANIVRGEN